MTHPQNRLGGSRHLPLLSLLLGAFILGMSAILVKWAKDVPSPVLGFYRMAIATLCLAPWVLMREGFFRRSELPALGWAALGGLAFSMDLWSWHISLRYTSAASATLLVGLAPLWVSLFSLVTLRQVFRPQTWMGLGLALGGAALLGLSAGASLGGGKGEILATLASFGYASFTLCLSKARQKLSATRSLLAAVASASCSFALISLIHQHPFTGFSVPVWTSILAIGLFVQIAAWVLISYGLGHMSASSGSLSLLLQQVATVFLGWMLLGEIPHSLQWVGVVAILAGIALTTLYPATTKATGKVGSE